VLVLGLVLVQQLVIKPTRGVQLATECITDLVTLRQGTGRVPLRYIPGFHRARVTRSGFDAVAPEEAHIEARLREAAELAPGQVESQTALGLYLLDKGVLDEAESRLHEALEIDPESLAAKNGLAVVYYENALRDSKASQDLLRRGLELLREAGRANPQDLQISFNLAMFYQQLGFIDRARVSWTKYLKLDPDSEWAEVAREKLEELKGS
jgi:cytochrome c-type biogenesis protein CcmH/NrfG